MYRFSTVALLLVSSLAPGAGTPPGAATGDEPSVAASNHHGDDAANAGLRRPGIVVNEVCWWTSCRLDSFESSARAGSARREGGWIVEQTGPWIEIYNPAGRLNLAGWKILGADGGVLVELPAWVIPPRSYLVVSFGAGVDDGDFSDRRGLFFVDRKTKAPLPPDGGPAAAILTDLGDTIVDAVVWSPDGHAVSGTEIDRAVSRQEWPQDEVFPFADHYTALLTRAVLQGESFGRSMRSDDTNTLADWAASGGPDTILASPGRPNGLRSREAIEKGALSKKLTVPPDAGPRVWTILLYLDGRDPNLATDFFSYLVDISTVGSSPQVQFVAQLTEETDAGLTARRWSMFNTINGREFRIQQTRNEIIIPPGEKTNPGDPQALADFIDWAESLYPAQKYAIVMAGHGRGWKGTNVALGLPEHGPRFDLLTMSELEEGLQALGSLPFDTLIFESCVMGTVEVAYQLDGEVEHLVASPEVMWSAIMPWKKIAEIVVNDPNQTGEDIADHATRLYSNFALKTFTKNKYTISHISPPMVASLLFPLINTFAAALETDVENIRMHDNWKDNLQVTIFEQVLTPSEKFHDGSYRDLGDLADHAANTPELSASQPAMQVRDALKFGPGVILRRHRGPYHFPAYGLSIYFPHAQMKPNREASQKAEDCAHLEGHCGDMRVFDNPRPCPHIYARDPDFRLPKTESYNCEDDEQEAGSHTMWEDPGFHFTDDGNWDEFLHRFYKPVADACIRYQGACLPSVSVPVGTTVQLSGFGSSDIDTDRSQKKHQPEEWHWDLDTTKDSPQDLQDYLCDEQYPCTQEDCDRNESDGLDDDPDAHGEVIDYTCAEEGTYPMNLWTWDDHNTHGKEYREDEVHNEGKHWLHFNLDDMGVTVTCEKVREPPVKRVDASAVRPGEPLRYEIEVPNTGGDGTGEPVSAEVFDTLPPEVLMVEESLQCPPNGDCFYSEADHAVIWNGILEEGDIGQLVFDVVVREDVPCIPPEPGVPPPEIINNADVRVGETETTVEASTELECPGSV